MIYIVKKLFWQHKLLFIILPCVILLAVAAFIIASRVNAMREVEALTTEGNRYLSELDYERAIACYEQALLIDERNREANLALAECYEMTDRDTYARSVYETMINQRPSDAEAYTRLAELYIRTGEPEAAVELMEKAAEKVKPDEITEIYQLNHTSATTFSCAPGSYDERIKVELVCEDVLPSAIYYTLDGSEPTIESQLYDAPLILKNGANQIKAVSINSSGFVSEVAVGDYQINIEDIAVDLADEQLEVIIRNELEIPNNEPIYNDDIEQITSLVIIGGGYYSINGDDNITFDGNGYSVNGSYRTVNQSDGRVETLSDIADLPFLETLVVAYQSDLDISALAGSKSIRELSLIGDSLEDSDIASLSGLVEVTDLSLGWNNLKSLTALSSLSKLTSLSFWGNAVRDLAPISNLTSLEYLDFTDNKVTDVSAISGLTSLVELWMYDNAVTTISPLGELESLEVLMLRGNPIGDPESVRSIYPHLVRIDVDLLGLGDKD